MAQPSEPVRPALEAPEREAPAEWESFRCPGLWAPLVAMVGFLVFPLLAGAAVVVGHLSRLGPGQADLKDVLAVSLAPVDLLTRVLLAAVCLVFIAAASRRHVRDVVRAATVVSRRDWPLITWVFVASYAAGTALEWGLVRAGLDTHGITEFLMANPGIAVGAFTIGPVAEELWGRGLVYGALRRRGPWTAILGSALLSSTIHLNWAQAVGTLPSMLAYGWVRYKTGRIGPSIVLHAASNFLSLALTFLVPGT